MLQLAYRVIKETAMMHTQKVLSILAGFVAVGCAGSSRVSPAELFGRVNPEERCKYVVLEATSIKAMEFDFQMYSGAERLLRDVQESLDECPRVRESLSARIDAFRANRRIQWQNLKSLREKLVPGDYLYVFEYKAGPVEETGILILNNGNVRQRFVFTTNQLRSPEDDSMPGN